MWDVRKLVKPDRYLRIRRSIYNPHAISVAFPPPIAQDLAASCSDTVTIPEHDSCVYADQVIQPLGSHASPVFGSFPVIPTFVLLPYYQLQEGRSIIVPDNTIGWCRHSLPF
jgi:hypothetical protein